MAGNVQRHFSDGRMRKITLKHTLPTRLAKHFDDDLNDSQRTAVTAPDGYNLILAGPGSGKTRRDHLPRGLPDRPRSPGRVDPAGHLHPPRGPGDGAAARSPDRPASGQGLGRRRSTTSATGCSAGRPGSSAISPTSRSWIARTSSTSSAWPWTTRVSARRTRWHRRPARSQHLISFALNTTETPGRCRSPSSHPSWSTGCPRSRASAARLRPAQARGELHGLRRPARPVAAAAATSFPSSSSSRRACSATS